MYGDIPLLAFVFSNYAVAMYAVEWLPERSESGLVLTFFYLRLIVITYLTIKIRIPDSFRQFFLFARITLLQKYLKI